MDAIQNQMYWARQASLDKMYYAEAAEEADEQVEDDGNDTAAAEAGTAAEAPIGELTAPEIPDPKVPAPVEAGTVETGTKEAPVEDPKAPATPTPTETPATPETPKDPLTPTDTVGGTVGQEQDGLVEDPELFKQVVSCLEEGHGGKGNSDMSFPNLKRALEKKGLKVNISGGTMLDTGKENTEDLQINATMEVTGSDGKRVVFHDTNGDGGIGVTDEGFAKAVQQYTPEKAAHLQQGKSDQRQNVALRAQGIKPPNAKKEALAKNFGGGGGGEAAAAPAASAAGENKPADENKPAAASEASASIAAPTAPTAENKPEDPAAAIASRVASGDKQVKANGDDYKFQVKDCDLNKCPKGKKQCNACGDCIKAELKKLQKDGGSIEGATKPDDENEDNKAGEITATEATTPEQAQADKQVVEKVDTPDVSVNGTTVANADDDKKMAEALKFIQSHLDSYGFTDKTAEELLADGQLEQIALQLGINLPENISK
jgi:hypothetical protein